MKIEFEGTFEEIGRIFKRDEDEEFEKVKKVFIPRKKVKKRVRHVPRRIRRAPKPEPEQVPEREVETMLRRKPVVPKPFEQERMELARRSRVVPQKPKPAWTWRTIVQENWPLVNSIIEHVAHAETHQRSKLCYEPDGKMIGCNTVGEWRDFAEELLSKSGMICQELGISNHWSVKGTGRDLEVWYG